MYRDRFQFHSSPFENTPDPRFFFASEQHREALAAIEYTIRLRKGIVLVTGSIGTGKTTVGRTMLKQFTQSTTIAQVLHGHKSGNELIHHVARSLNLNIHLEDDHATCLEKVKRFLLDRSEHGKPVVLFIDEAQTLSDEALEEVRLISNFDTNTQKLLQLVLIGQPELRDRITQPHMDALRQRIVLSKELKPFTFSDLLGYVHHRIKTASINPETPLVSFDDEALKHVYRFSQGIPRLINVACDNALLVGFVKNKNIITSEIVQQVICNMVPSLGQCNDIHIERTPYKMAGNF